MLPAAQPRTGQGLVVRATLLSSTGNPAHLFPPQNLAHELNREKKRPSTRASPPSSSPGCPADKGSFLTASKGPSAATSLPVTGSHGVSCTGLALSLQVSPVKCVINEAQAWPAALGPQSLLSK